MAPPECAQAASGAPVALENVSKAFDASVALQGVDLTLAEHTTTAIVGESGCGKSTLLQLVNGLVRPDSGTVRVFGGELEARHLVSLRRRIGYAVQQIALFPHLTVFANVTLAAHLADWTPADQRARFEHLMALLGLDAGLAGRYPVHLSGGQQQRVGLCRAMMLAPPVLLLDEPFSAVDPITRAGIHEEYLALRRQEPCTCLLVTHDVREAVRLADHLVVMRAGRILRQGPTGDVCQAPGDAYVARLLESQLA